MDKKINSIRWDKKDRDQRERLLRCLEYVVGEFRVFVKSDLFDDLEDGFDWDRYFTQGKNITADQPRDFFAERSEWFFHHLEEEVDPETWKGGEADVPLYRHFTMEGENE